MKKEGTSVSTEIPFSISAQGSVTWIFDVAFLHTSQEVEQIGRQILSMQQCHTFLKVDIIFGLVSTVLYDCFLRVFKCTLKIIIYIDC